MKVRDILRIVVNVAGRCFTFQHFHLSSTAALLNHAQTPSPDPLLLPSRNETMNPTLKSNRLTLVCRSFVATAALLATTLTAHADRPCPPDIDCSGTVNVTDLLAVIGAWGTAGGNADVDNSGEVNVTDLLAVIGAWGPCQFDYGTAYPNAEAHQIGLEHSSTITLSQAMYDRIDRDLGLIRVEFPELVNEPHSPAWSTSAMLVAVIQGSDLSDYQCANAYYRKTSETLLFSFGGTDYYVVNFDGTFNPVALAEIYSALPGIAFAEPDGLIGGQNFYDIEDLGNGTWRWTIDDGFWDCFDGCDCHRVYTIDVTARGVVTLVSYEEWGFEWCKW